MNRKCEHVENELKVLKTLMMAPKRAGLQTNVKIEPQLIAQGGMSQVVTSSVHSLITCISKGASASY
jgi:hypothetical protein